MIATPSWAIWVPVAVVVAALMEPWAMLLHGMVWHGPLFFMHGSHHAPARGRFEWNDVLSALHAPIAIALVLYGCRASPGVAREACFGVGLGMTFFGIAYFVVHDGFVHGRLRVEFLSKYKYFRRLKVCHQAHHRVGDARAPYGLFLGFWEMARARGLRKRRPGSV